MRVQVLTNVRADQFFLAYWVSYYGGIFGRENLHVMRHGDDWEADVDLTGVNVHLLEYSPQGRIERDRSVALWQSRFANRLLAQGTDLVLRTDIDEFLAVDPQAGCSLPDYLASLGPGAMQAAMGLDVIHATGESSLDENLSLLQQRRHAIVTREYCKLVAVRRPLRWIGGFHRGRNVEISLSPRFLLFHLALCDQELADRRIASRKSVAEDASEAGHIEKRLDRFAEVRGGPPLEYDSIRDAAHAQLMQSIPTRRGPAVGAIRDGNVGRGYHVRIPDRMTHLLPPIASVLRG